MEKIGHLRVQMPHTEPRQRRVNPSAFDQEGEIKSPMQRAANQSAQVSQLRSVQAASNAGLRQFKKEAAAARQPPVQRQENKTGMPDPLKSGIEDLSGMSMDDVRVHYNSSEPAQMNAHAFAQGSDIHVAAGQEQHLAHEAWHVVQQKQGRVKATTQMKGMGVNDDSTLEKEADEMGAKAMQLRAAQSEATALQSKTSQSTKQLKSIGLGAGTHIPVQLRVRNPANGTLVDSTSVDIWLSSVASRKGHLFSRDLGNKTDKAELIAEITRIAGQEGNNVAALNWVDDTDNYNKPQELANDPFRLRLHGVHGVANTAYSVDVHFGPYNHGYIVHVNDDGADGEMANRGHVGGGVPLTTYSNMHHHRGNNELLTDTNHAGGAAVTREQKLDASTKLIGEGARFVPVANHQANLTDNTKFIIRNDPNNTTVRWIKFEDLWLTWAATFGKAFNIPHARVIEHLTNDSFMRINPVGGTMALAAANGVPADIAPGRDYLLRAERAANQNDTHIWHTMEIRVLSGIKNVNATDKREATEALEAVPGVMNVTPSSKGKTYTVQAWDIVLEATLQAALPAWAQPVPDLVVEGEGLVQDEAEPEILPLPVLGMPESDFNGALNRKLDAMGLGRATKGAKAALRQTIRGGHAVGLTYNDLTNRYIVRGGGLDIVAEREELDKILTNVIGTATVEVEEVKPSKTWHTESSEKGKIKGALIKAGATQQENGNFTMSLEKWLFIIAAMAALFAAYYMISDKK